MRVFVTGASGHIGSAVVVDLLEAGHKVVGLARSEPSAEKIKAAGAEVVRGDLDDIDGLRAAAKASDGVIHLGYKHDLAFGGTPDGFVKAAQHDDRVVQAIGEVLVGTNKPFVNTSGTAQLALIGRLTRTGTEEDVLPGGPRVDAENSTIALAQRGVRSSVVRLPPTVHSSLDHYGFVPMFVAAARKNGFAVYVGDGANVWPAVHTLDAARLYRLALESAPAGTRLHAVADEGVPFRAIIEAIAKGVGVPAKSVTAEEASTFLGPLAHFAPVNNPTSSTRTRALLAWQPTHADLLTDLAEGHYFKER
ncbi:NAD-dependent epimerase/dehydratase [Labilithrix luteola]|uniref:NAD-dependent epimerase/dehydratase n=1 Tax=Labilithrix luteola TaxID=1391654 RepID=A0A0K1QES5_9BACT|nr:SDR family oxidoreductase [Labilithrix luteola]AKV04259.1 NAD-dependent epimerase/dehydratase [Labilithrix luteola]